MPEIILDHIKGITYDPDTSTVYNCSALGYFPEGIHKLAVSVRQKELNKIKTGKTPSFGQNFSDPEELAIACEFHWFANTLVNYTRLIGYIDVMHKKGWETQDLSNNTIKKTVKKHCTDYVKDTLGEVYIWRNKVSAHFSSTDPLPSDNIGTLQDSMDHPISYCRPYYFVHAIKLSHDGNESSIPSWSLTKVFEETSLRFFPERTIIELPSDIV